MSKKDSMNKKLHYICYQKQHMMLMIKAKTINSKSYTNKKQNKLKPNIFATKPNILFAKFNFFFAFKMTLHLTKLRIKNAKLF